MGAFFSSFLAIIGELAYTLPAAFLIYFLREWFRNFILQRFGQKPEYPPLYYVDTVAIGILSLWGVSWGGIIHSRRFDNIVTYILGQLFFIVLFFLIFFYMQLNKPEVNSYSYSLFTAMGFNCFVLFLLNFLPLPPFDLSFVFMQDLIKGVFGKTVLIVLKISVFLLLFFQVLEDDYFFKSAIVKFLAPGN